MLGNWEAVLDEAFNSLLEMLGEGALGTAEELAYLFQFSIGDARWQDIYTVPVAISLFQFSIGDAIPQQIMTFLSFIPYYFQFSIGDAQTSFKTSRLVQK